MNNRIDRVAALIATMLLPFINATAQTAWDTCSDTWVAVDELGRNVATADNGVERKDIDTDVKIGMFYYIWHGQHNDSGKDITELLKENPDNPDWGAVNTFHWGSRPWLGYYTAGDRYIVSRHMQMMMDAGIDFIFIDATNGYHYPDQVNVICTEYNRREALGLKVPKIAFMLHSRTAATIEKIYADFYKKKDSKYWFCHEGKPLILADKNELIGNVSDEILNYFTFRNSWAWMQGQKPDEWSWLEFYPQAPGWTQPANGLRSVEQISVSVAQHPNSKIGKSYHNGKQPAFDKYGLCKETPYGLYFQEQWDRAREVHAPIVMITQFNEWMAQRFVITNENEFGYIRPGATASIGETYFVDVYNAEFNRDIEPSSHPLIRDNYYLQLVSNVRKYRGARPIPVPTVNLSIDIDNAFTQWDAETVQYLDDKQDALYTSKTAQTPATLTRTTNDIIEAKVTQDAANLYFYVRTNANITKPETSDRWMRLFINSDTDYSTGWYGYDYCVYKDPETGIYSLMKHDRDFRWTTIAPVRYRLEKNKMHLCIPRDLMGLNGYRDIDFKWTDNIPDDNPDVMSFISDGDVAPNGRFNYRYKGAAVPSGIDDVATDHTIGFDINCQGNTVTFTHMHSAPVSIHIYNTMGMECFTREHDTTGNITCTLPTGIYIVRYTSGATTATRKFICR